MKLSTKPKLRKGSSHPTIYVLVDKRGTILERSKLKQATSKSCEVPIFTIWRDRTAANFQRDAIKESMSPKTWETWKFRVVKYNREGQK